MFKNTLFLKIILVFTLPALGMMYFSTVLVYEKIQSLSETVHLDKNLQYITKTQELVESLQKERGFTAISLSSKRFKQELKHQREETNRLYKDFLTEFHDTQKQSLFTADIKKTQNLFQNLQLLRINVDNRKLPVLRVLKEYNQINAFLLQNLRDLTQLEYAASFNIQFSYLLDLLEVKELSSIEKVMTSLVLFDGLVSRTHYKILIENYILQNQYLNHYLQKASVNEVNYYNTQIPLEKMNAIIDIRDNINDYLIDSSIQFEDWWELSSVRMSALKDIYSYSQQRMKNHSIALKNDANMEQFLSLCFLFVSFSTLISLLFVLKNIIFNEQKSYNKLNKQQEVYKLLNAVNIFLIKSNKSTELYQEICKLISLTQSMSFGFVYKVSKKKTTLIAQEGPLKNILDIKLQEENNRSNLITKAIDLDRNVVVDSFEKQDLSILTDVAKEHNLKSAAAFPIKRFNKTIAIMVLYSNENYFFDNEIEILFNNMINDMTHSLEKIEYEKTRIAQEQELKIASYAFESHEPMIITNSNVEIINANQAFCDTLGYSKDEIIGKIPSMFKSKHHGTSFYEAMWKDIDKKGSWSGELYNTKKNKQLIPLRSTITAIKGEDGENTHYLAQYLDISAQIDKQKVLEYQATHDNLTGLPNRLLLLDRIERAVTKVERHNIVGGLIFIDLDNFKEVNDTLGHEIGDKLLILVAQKINKTIRKEDTIARIGGDEFIVLADHIGNTQEEAKENINSLAEKIKLSLNSIIEIDGHKNISTPSIGATLFNDSSVNIKEIIKEADTAMYKAKKQGKNRVALFAKS